jgi:hypothetical protein
MPDCALVIAPSLPSPISIGALSSRARPFSFANEQRVRRILANAGFHSVILEPRDFDRDIAGGGGIEQALDAAMAFGLTSRALQDQSAETRSDRWCRQMKIAASLAV